MGPTASHSQLEHNVDKAGAIKRRSKNPVGVQKQTQSHLMDSMEEVMYKWRFSSGNAFTGEK